MKPVTIHRRIYLKLGTNPYYLAKTIEDNTTVTTTITTTPTVTIEPPEFSMVNNLGNDPILVEASGHWLSETELEAILATDPNLGSTGVPSCYARISPTKIMLYPRPSSSLTLSYWVQKKPQRIFADENRVIQMDPSFKIAHDAGVTWKGYEYKDKDGQEAKLSNYEALKEKHRANKAQNRGQAKTVRRVC